jgi:tRNA (Thr-GGU) A37 N-methylase
MTAANGDVLPPEGPSPGTPVMATPTAAQNGTAAVAALDSIDAELNGLSGLDTADHVHVYAGIHQRLTSALAITGHPGGSTDPQPEARQPGH